MADLTTAQKAPLLIDGNPVASNTPGIATSDNDVASVANIANQFWIVGQAPGDANITADFQGRHGVLAVHVSAAPIALSLGTPEPK